MSQYGTLDASYHLGRKTRRALIYRLNRRTHEVIAAIQKYSLRPPQRIIDLGSADGLMLSRIKDVFPHAECLGIEYSEELIACNEDARITLQQGDVNSLTVDDDSQDVAVATAIIEHLPAPAQMLAETRRVLRPNGLLILTTPNPFWERVATILGHLPGESHFDILPLKALLALLNKTQYKILEHKRFMLSPIGLPWEHWVEEAVRRIRLHCLLANQLVVCRKSGSGEAGSEIASIHGDGRC